MEISMEIENDAPQEDEVVDNPEAETGTTTEPTESETPTEEDKQQAEAEHGKTFTQQDVDAIVQKRLARESRRIERQVRLEAENEFYRRQEEARQSQHQTQSKPSGPPKLEDFETAEDYIDALTDYKIEQREAQRQQKMQQERESQSESEFLGTVREKLLVGAEKHDDFQEVVDSIPDEYVTPAMFHAIAESDSASEISYFLGNNHAEAARIARLSPVKQVQEIDRLENKLKAPKGVSKAPPPMETTGRGRAKNEPDLEKMSVAEYAAYRAKTGARWAR